MMKKLIICSLLFCLLFLGGWLIDLHLNSQSLSRIIKVDSDVEYRLLMLQQDHILPFDPREYVRIVRVSAK